MRSLAVLAAVSLAACASNVPPGASTASSGGQGGAGAASTATSTGGSTSTGGTGTGTGGTGAGGAAPMPWSAPIERCNGADDDGDGTIDEDCPESLWAGAFPPGGGADLAGAKTIQKLEGDAGRPVSVIQTYHATSPAGVAKTPPDLDAIWSHGATPHLNVEPSGYTKAQYLAAATDPQIEADLQAMGAAVAGALAAHPHARLLFTFGAEMNGDWTDWGCLPAATYIALYRKAHDLVSAALAAEAPPVDPRRLRWVYGPNNTSAPNCGSAAGYYPGHAYVDYLGMSAYRSGTQSVASAVITPAHGLADATGMPPSWQRDRFIVLQTGTRDIAGDDRGAWIQGLFDGLRQDGLFLGVIYFDADTWALLGPAAQPLTGYPAWASAVAALPPASARLDGTFEPFFWDVRVEDPHYAEIQSLRAAGVTSGCGSAPPTFCPDDPLSRTAAAIFTARAFGIAPDPAGPQIFDDIAPGAPGYGEIQALAKLGALAGCSATSFCPAAPIDRRALAVVLAALSHPPPATPGAFTDLDPTDPASAAVEALAALARVEGCGAGAFCPAAPATRSDGAAWIVRSSLLEPAPGL